MSNQINMYDKPLDELYVDAQIEKRRLSIYRLRFFIIPLIVCSACLFVNLYSIHIPSAVRLVGAVLYVLSCMSYYYTYFDHRGQHLFGEIEKQIYNDIAFYKTPNLPDNPPICNGYIYAKKIGLDYSKPYELKFELQGRRVLTMDGYMTECFASIKLAGKDYNYHCYDGVNLDRFKLNALRDFESGGYEVKAIKNEFGQYLWIKGDYFKHGKFYKWYQIAKLSLLKVLLFVSLLVPLISLLKPYDLSESDLSKPSIETYEEVEDTWLLDEMDNIID